MVSDLRCWLSDCNFMASLNPCSNGIWSLTSPRSAPSASSRDVLILVLMEYGLWPGALLCPEGNQCVLILVLMEYGLWPGDAKADNSNLPGLNPCSNGIWSLTCWRNANRSGSFSLNPCSNGIWSLTDTCDVSETYSLAGLNPCSNGIWSLTQHLYRS